MSQIGIVEGFFGPSWSREARLSFAPFLKKVGGDFYIYAPKRDAFLRKAWRESWTPEYLDFIHELKTHFQLHGIKFGLALSPFGLGTQITNEDWQILRGKFKQLSDLKIDYLGLFFDDMPSTDKLLEVQTSVLNLASEYFEAGLIFCPRYYSLDPILDKVFGPRPDHYVESLSTSIPSSIEICWTGPKVISEEISSDHLSLVHSLLGRRPFIWENLFANDGPKNCKFLKLRSFTGRDKSFLKDTSGVGFNLMNQAYLSQLLYLSSLYVLKQDMDPDQAFAKSCKDLCSNQLAEFILENRLTFLNQGLDKIDPETKAKYLSKLSEEGSLLALEIASWLKGEFIVGPECLTD